MPTKKYSPTTLNDDTITNNFSVHSIKPGHGFTSIAIINCSETMWSDKRDVGSYTTTFGRRGGYRTD